MSEAVTPAAEPNAQAPAATPAAAEPTATATEETVTLPKEELAQLQRDAARAASAQKELDRLKKNAGKANSFRQTPAAPVATERTDDEVQAEERKAERGLLNLALDPDYREILDNSPDLRELLTKNPLGALPILAADALDADDAIALVKENLDQRAKALKQAKKPATPAPSPAAPSVPASPKPNGVNAPSQKEIDVGVEEARKIVHTESAIAGMIGARLPRQIGSK